MAMSKECMKTDNRPRMELIQFPAALITQLSFDVHNLLDMHETLIRMYDLESSLKKQHKAYLHIRERADELCRRDRMRLEEISDHYRNPGRHIDQAVCFHNLIKQLDEQTTDRDGEPTLDEILQRLAEVAGKADMVPGKNGEGETDQELCSDKCEEKELSAQKTKEEASEAESEDAEETDIDVFELPEGMVMMSTETLGVMQDDMLALTMVVDRLVEALREIGKSRRYNKSAMNLLAKESGSLASDVFSRWDDADLAEIN